jgi:SAM-dependent methyltransferase
MIENVVELNSHVEPLRFPHPTDTADSVAWNNGAFEYDGRSVRVLAYQVSPSGWTEELTLLHEQTGGSNHFIDVASRKYACAEVIRCITHPSSSVLEIGCSSGFLLRDLVARLPGHRILGADYTYQTLEVLGKQLPDVPLIQFDLTQCPLPDDSIDVIVLLNVLEHISNDQMAIAQLSRIVRPGGAVIIEVPAGPSLFDVHDRVLLHHRRYAMSALAKVIERQGLVVERRSHLGFFLYPGFYLTKRLNQLRYPVSSGLDEEKLVAGMIKATRNSSTIMNFVMKGEQALRPYIYYPFGVRCLVTCRKAGSIVHKREAKRRDRWTDRIGRRRSNASCGGAPRSNR